MYEWPYLFPLIEFIYYLVLFLVGCTLRDIFSPFSARNAFIQNNTAAGICRAGFLFSFFYAISRFVSGGEYSSISRELLGVGIQIALLVLLLIASEHLVWKFLFKRLKIVKRIEDDENEGFAWAVTGCIFAFACISSSAINQSDFYWAGDLNRDSVEPIFNGMQKLAAGYLLCTLLILVLFSSYFKFSIKHFPAMISGRNSASAISLGGYFAACGLILAELLDADLILYRYELLHFLKESLFCIALLTASRTLLFDSFFAGGERLSEAAAYDNNRAAGWISAFGSIGISLVLIRLFS